jgi:glutathione reductase (NADPH)
LRIDWSELMRFKRTFTEPVPSRTERQMAEAGIATFHGVARFTGRTTLQVGSDVLEGRYVAIAAGAKPADLKIDGADLLITSDDFLELNALPKRIVFVGGGYIAFEFAHVAARAGARVSIVHRGAKPLERFDPDLVDRLSEATRELGVDIHLQAEVKAIKRCAGGLCVTASAPGAELAVEADMVVHAAGRVPDVDDLDLAAGGVERYRGGVKVNDYLQSSSNPAVYAAGDAAASGPPLTPVASYEGGIAARNMLQGNHLKPNYDGVPSVVFSIPPLASTGLREAEARERGYRFQCNLQDTSSWYSSRRVREKHSGLKVLVEEGGEKILGAHLLGQEAGETINLFALAIRYGLTASHLKDALYAYPTHGSDIRYML